MLVQVQNQIVLLLQVFVSYKALAGGNKISRKSNMKGGKKLSLEPANCKGDVNHRHHALGTYDNGPVPRPYKLRVVNVADTP